MEREIKDSLMLLLDGIKRSDGKSVAAQLVRLDELLEAHRETLHPQLVHFLEGRSYAKAVAWLEAQLPGTERPRMASTRCGK